MVTYNNPALGASFEKIAQMFAPPSPQEMAAITQMQIEREKAARQAQLWGMAGGDFDKANIAVGNYAPTQSYYAQNQNNATQRYGYDTSAATQRANNAADNARALAAQAMSPLGPGYTQPGLPSNVAQMFGLPELPRVDGAPDPKAVPQSAQEWQFGQENPGYLDWLRQGNTGTEYGTTPIFGRDAQGNVVIMQAGKNGTIIQSQMPDGVNVDLGVKPFETARNTATGKAVGEAAMTTGAAEDKTGVAIGLIDSIIADPALPGITGMFQGRLPPLTQKGTDLGAKIDQLTGQAFLEAFATLRGGGQITEIEGKKATDAMARLSRAQSDTAFKAALADMRDVLTTGMARRQQQLQIGPTVSGAPAPMPMPPAPPAPPQPSAPPGMPAPGDVVDGYRFIGGNPGDPAAWEAVQ